MPIPTQLMFDFEWPNLPQQPGKAVFNDPAFAENKTLPIHRWVPWIAGFSRGFVRGALESYLGATRGVVLDPFAGVGTTLVEGMLMGHDTIGFEINPYPFLATQTKLNIKNIALDALEFELIRFRAFYADAIRTDKIPTLAAPTGFKTRIPFYSPSILKKVLYVLDFISTLTDQVIRDIFRIAFAATMVSYSNYSYEPSLATRLSSGKKNIEDFPVGESVLEKLEVMAEDVRWFWQCFPNTIQQHNRLINASFFDASHHLEPSTVDLIVTSPPYLNNYHYNRNTRPHLYWLGFANHPSELKNLEEANFGTYWQTARDLAHVGLNFSLPSSELADSIEAIRALHPEKGIYGGKGWANYAARYFNDCLKFAQSAAYALKPGGYACVVIGNSILQGVMIPTDVYLADIAKLAGLEIISIDIPRATRVGNSIIKSDARTGKANPKHQLYEAVVTLRKP